MSSLHERRGSNSDGGQAVSKTRARQGVTGHNVRYVLGFGLTGIIIAFAIIYIFFFSVS